MDFVKANPDLRWVNPWGQWYRWSGKVWMQDETLAVYDEIRRFLRGNSWVTDRPPDLLKASTVAAVERLARSDRQCAATVDQWDADLMALNTLSGVINLETGELIDHVPGQHMTHIAEAEVAESSDCYRWLKFLDDITESDEELIDFLQRVVGYCLTGRTDEHALFFLYGTGANGKSTFLNVVTRILGGYARNAPMETFTASKIDRHPTELAMLRGARVVTATETEEGRRWAESRIKQLTGGDPVAARYMRQDFFVFRPQFKLLIAGNHKPRLHAVDEAMRRRLHLVPFEANFSGERRIDDMEERLLEESPQILRWMIDGCLEWQRKGLQPPKRVRAATEAYFSNQDIFREWISLACETGPDFWETPTRLFNSWRDFAKEAHHPPGARSSFNDRMETAGFHSGRDRIRGRYWTGLKLRPDRVFQSCAA